VGIVRPPSRLPYLARTPQFASGKWSITPDVDAILDKFGSSRDAVAKTGIDNLERVPNKDKPAVM
jgi:hypothetical protein